MRIVVTGGSGALGSLVVDEARTRGHDVTAISRRTGVDLATGDGLTEAVRGADAVVHCASNPRKPGPVDVDGTRRLVEALGPQTHLVHVSIVGCDASPFGYYVAKTKAEEILANAGVATTVVRATQFHAFAAMIAGALTKGPVALTLRGLAFQSVETAWVARRLVDHAEAPRPDGFVRATDLAGPEVLTGADIAVRLRRHAGRKAPHVLGLPAVGGAMRSFAQRTNLPGGDVETGGCTFDEWLATT
ncbi:NAD(P)H-binding protein [Nocardioides sp. AE5]|uniref:SDR family oxidoreductase n=1 Tax=Nocardioides sp. AE5 TaxID=2962573 RepID=UPI002882659B|nr:NAD(P)H-binding protein [Nocardioides sp. AE5]MDT0200522.1 NAD(P)H-binding protein [Nocardioides sp. AE5]